MAIKQLPFEVGEELGVRQKGNRFPENEILDNLKKNLERDDVLIVKCGKSFWDVTAYPEIFDAGEEFTVESLTATDLKQMEKPKVPTPAFKSPVQDPNPMSILFHKTDEVEEEEEEQERLVRKTYYLRPKDIEALTILCHETRVEVSAMVREIFERGINSIADEFEYGDIYAQAEENLANGVGSKKKSFKTVKR